MSIIDQIKSRIKILNDPDGFDSEEVEKIEEEIKQCYLAIHSFMSTKKGAPNVNISDDGFDSAVMMLGDNFEVYRDNDVIGIVLAEDGAITEEADITWNLLKDAKDGVFNVSIVLLRPE